MVDLGDDKDTKPGGEGGREREREREKERERERREGGRGVISVDRRSVYHSIFM